MIGKKKKLGKKISAGYSLSVRGRCAMGVKNRNFPTAAGPLNSPPFRDLYTIHNRNVTPSNDSYRRNSHFRISE